MRDCENRSSWNGNQLYIFPGYNDFGYGGFL